MIRLKEFPDKAFSNQEEAFKFLIANKTLIIAQKKSAIKYAEEDDETDDFEDTDFETDEEGNEFGNEDLDTDNDEEDMLDLTDASDKEVLKVFKAMKPEDGIVVKKDGNKLEVNTGSDEFIIKLEDETPDFEEDETPDFEEDETDELAEEETVYEIEVDEEECDDELEECGDKSIPEEEMKEAARTKWNPHGDKGGMNRSGLKSKKVFKAGSVQMNEEVKRLKKQNAEYKKALVLFKEKLNEVAVFNANLAYATRLFTEQTTTKSEKMNILKRFDSISTLTESKNLYKTIQTALS